MSIPVQREFLAPTLEAFRQRGSLRNAEVDSFLIESLGLSTEDVDELGSTGRPALEIKRNLAISQLKGMGFIERSERGVYSITDTGRQAGPDDLDSQSRLWHKSRPRRSGNSDQTFLDSSDVDAEVVVDADDEWKRTVIQRIVRLSPRSFERLIRDLLLEAGFARAEITNHGADDGIDGTGEYSSGLTTQPVIFQAKRFNPRNPVNVSHVRDLQGALGTVPDVRGLLITTSSFTSAAKEAAVDKGKRRIQLVDGYELCDLMLEYNVGVTRVPAVDEKWFAGSEGDSVNDGHSERQRLNL